MWTSTHLAITKNKTLDACIGEFSLQLSEFVFMPLSRRHIDLQ